MKAKAQKDNTLS